MCSQLLLVLVLHVHGAAVLHNVWVPSCGAHTRPHDSGSAILCLLWHLESDSRLHHAPAGMPRISNLGQVLSNVRSLPCMISDCSIDSRLHDSSSVFLCFHGIWHLAAGFIMPQPVCSPSLHFSSLLLVRVFFGTAISVHGCSNVCWRTKPSNC